MTATSTRPAEETASRPVIARDAAELGAARRAALTRQPGPVAVVMTMGALHEGHEELFAAARRRAAVVIVTIFVNPLQFGPTEDLDRYPRTFEADIARCAAGGVDIVYAPSVAEVYPSGTPMVTVRAGAMGDRLEGEFRPGFFDGVLTVVIKLLHLTAPDLTFFGQKDAQQLAMVRRMIVDLSLPVEVVAVPTAREPDGLARSSRNRYLSAPERRTALALSAALRAGVAAVAAGPAVVLAAARAELAAAEHAEPPLSVDYLALVDAETFQPLVAAAVDTSSGRSAEPERPAGQDRRSGSAVLAVAARVGGTRLIDNMLIDNMLIDTMPIDTMPIGDAPAEGGSIA